MTRSGRLFRDAITAFALLALIALLATALNKRPQTILSGDFTVVDGDSLTHGGKRLRLRGIDAPEYRQQCERSGVSWPCGQEARALLAKLLQGGAVQCLGSERDRYDRLLASCTANGSDINAEMVRRGLAVAFGSYQREEQEARAAKSGLWAGTFERPQDYRRDEAGEPRQRSNLLADAADFVSSLLGWSK